MYQTPFSYLDFFILLPQLERSNIILIFLSDNNIIQTQSGFVFLRNFNKDNTQLEGKLSHAMNI